MSAKNIPIASAAGRKSDMLGSMLRARNQSITESIENAEAQIEAIECWEGYWYELEAIEVKAKAAE